MLDSPKTPKRAFAHIRSQKLNLIFCVNSDLISTILVSVKNLTLDGDFLIESSIISILAKIFWEFVKSEESH